MKFHHYKKGGRKCFNHAKGGGGGAQNVLGYFLHGSLKFWPY